MILNDRDYLIISEVSRWRTLQGRQVRMLCNFQGIRACDNRLKKLIDDGYLERKRYIYGVAGILTITGKAKKHFGITLPVNEPRLDQIEHDIAVIDTAIYFIKKLNVTQTDIKSEKQLRHEQGFGTRVHLPDFVFTQDDNKYCVEVELNLKGKERLRKNIEQNFMNYQTQYWVIPKDRPLIEKEVEYNKNAFHNIEIISLGVIDEFIQSLR